MDCWSIRVTSKILRPLLHHSNTPLIHAFSPGFPWRVRLHVQRRRPRDQRRNCKTRGGTGNKGNPTDFASGFGRARRFGSAIRPYLSLLNNFARLCAGRSRSFWEMRRKHLPDVANRVHERVRESFVTKMFAHTVDNLPPINVAASFVDRLIAHDCEFASAGRDKNEDAVAFACLVHSKPLKFLLGRNQRISIQLSTLDIDADLRGCFRFSLANRLHNSIVLELAQKLSCSHVPTS